MNMVQQIPETDSVAELKACLMRILEPFDWNCYCMACHKNWNYTMRYCGNMDYVEGICPKCKAPGRWLFSLDGVCRLRDIKTENEKRCTSNAT